LQWTGLLRWAVTACAAVIVGEASGIARGSIVTNNPSDWTQTFNDDFDGSALDPTKWVYRLTGVRNSAINTPNAVSVGGGALTINGCVESSVIESGHRQRFDDRCDHNRTAVRYAVRE